MTWIPRIHSTSAIFTAFVNVTIGTMKVSIQGNVQSKQVVYAIHGYRMNPKRFSEYVAAFPNLCWKLFDYKETLYNVDWTRIDEWITGKLTDADLLVHSQQVFKDGTAYKGLRKDSDTQVRYRQVILDELEKDKDKQVIGFGIGQGSSLFLDAVTRMKDPSAIQQMIMIFPTFCNLDYMYANCVNFAHVPMQFVYSKNDPIHVYTDYFHDILQATGCKVSRYETPDYKTVMVDAKTCIFDLLTMYQSKL
jgi:hypothetical protein